MKNQKRVGISINMIAEMLKTIQKKKNSRIGIFELKKLGRDGLFSIKDRNKEYWDK